ncbi:hypothetical protein HN873_007928 [Arachis hypogaea]
MVIQMPGADYARFVRAIYAFAKVPKRKKVRGPTELKHIHALETQIELTWFNGKPIGLTKIQVQLFSRFLGILARNSNLVTLLYTNWQAVSSETKTSMLDYAKVSQSFSFLNCLQIDLACMVK